MKNFRFSEWWTLYGRLPFERRILLSAAGLALVPLALQVFLSSSSRQQESANARRKASDGQIDTYIPKGFVLVPIEVQNYEALDSILGRFGIVDLYQTSGTVGLAASPQRLVMRNVRILRAPQNPSHFAVLVAEQQASDVLRFGGQFTVIVKRPGEDGTEFVKDPSQNKRQIIYEGG